MNRSTRLYFAAAAASFAVTFVLLISDVETIYLLPLMLLALGFALLGERTRD